MAVTAPAPGYTTLATLDHYKLSEETMTVEALLRAVPLSPEVRAVLGAQAADLVRDVRAAGQKPGLVESFLQQFSLATPEGLALMCLAESLLRTPDSDTRDRLIAEKVGSADWARHLGQSENIFVNASTWGLMLTGKLVDVEEQARADVGAYVRALAQRLGEPVIRKAVAAAVRIMGEQFVLSHHIDGALARAQSEHLCCSFDMLGEGARTMDEAARFADLYAHAITQVGQAEARQPKGHSISVKLSALYPRFEAHQQTGIMTHLYPAIVRLAELAAHYHLDLTLDAEEADRLIPSMQIVEKLLAEPRLRTWRGLGVVVQAYQKRARPLIHWLARTARAHEQQLRVRLVKGAYWDSEIKRAQQAGLDDYAVYTSKAATDVSYLVCVQELLKEAPILRPQFATHNALSLICAHHLAGRANVAVEFQRLHGMGDALYAAMRARHPDVRVRTYAPVGAHEELLPYLVRRLLENGANSSFVHHLTDHRVAADVVVADPVALLEQGPLRNPRIALPVDLHGPARRNAPGRDLSQAYSLYRLERAKAAVAAQHYFAGPLIGGVARLEEVGVEVFAPHAPQLAIGRRALSRSVDSDDAVMQAQAAQPAWDQAGGAARAQILRAMADQLAAHFEELVQLLALEAGKTLADGVAEVREAIDFCRYYAHLAESQCGQQDLGGPVGERNMISLHGRGVFLCISPWNFPLVIFTGQIAAALAAGNAVVAKPAEQTPLIAARAVQLFHQAGLDPALLALLPGRGEDVGAALVRHSGIAGVAFTGGTQTASHINKALAARKGPILPFIAETGGLNAMFVDTSALQAQVIDDVMLSAFGSAGQRCSALRLLFVPHDNADALIAGLVGAAQLLRLGDPADPATDMGPLIDQEALDGVQAHIALLAAQKHIIWQGTRPETLTGSFCPPVIAEVPAPDWLTQEIFGPVLHICRYDPADVAQVGARLARLGFGLTLGIHSRLKGFAQAVQRAVPAGNIYINRGMTGAVVGVQPFGGEGLSGTGPKAGGPWSLTRFAVERVVSNNIAAQGGDPALLNL